MSDPKIFDAQGNQQDMRWLKSTYGNVQIQRAQSTAGARVFRLVELREKIGPSAVVATLYDHTDETGDAVEKPMHRVPVVRYWPDAPELPTWDPPPERWYDRGVVGRTDENGAVGFGMGRGDYYDPATEQGASAIWCAKPEVHSDLVAGLGMIAGTNHAHLDLTFHLIAIDDPDPDPTPWEAIAQALYKIEQGYQDISTGVGLLATVAEKLAGRK